VVDDQEINGFALDGAGACVSILGENGAVLLMLQDHSDGGANCRIVVNNRDRRLMPIRQR
jgi:hypothetical protein